MGTLKWIGAAFLGFLTVLYAGMLLRGEPNRGAMVFLVLVCGAGAWALARSARRHGGGEADSGSGSGRNWTRDEMGALQRDVVGLADAHGGVLTVSDVVADLQWPPSWADEVLRSLDDGVRVAASVTEDGVIVYEFREVMHRHRRLGGMQGEPQA